MHQRSFRKWIRQVYGTRDVEPDCEELFQVIPQYVEMNLAGKESARHLPEVEHHLRQCAECYDLYLTLRDVAVLEQKQMAEYANLRRS